MLGDAGLIEPVVLELGWKFSKIDGDPNLGDGVKCYATIQLNKKIGVKSAVQRLMGTAEAISNGCPSVQVLRRKIELVIFDDRSKLVPCTGACVECLG